MIPTITTMGTNTGCAANVSNLVAACNAHSFDALTWGLVIGMLIGAFGLYAGTWYNGNRKIK